MTSPEPNDWPTHERFDERRAQAERLRQVVQAARIRLEEPRLEAVFMPDAVVIAECFGVRRQHFQLGAIYGRLPLDDLGQVIRFVEGLNYDDRLGA